VRIGDLKEGVEYEMIIPPFGVPPCIVAGAIETHMRRLLIFKKGENYKDYQPFWLYYDPGFITEVECGGWDVMSGYFSGCYFVKYRRNGRDYVGHIGTHASSTSPESLRVKAAWNTFVQRPDVDLLCGFNPARHISSIGGQKVLAVITGSNDCYAFRATIFDVVGTGRMITFQKGIKVFPLSPDELSRIFPQDLLARQIFAGVRSRSVPTHFLGVRAGAN
jgi:hypothetical protein